MEELGFQFISWNPYDMAMIRSSMGLQQRLQVQIAEMLKGEHMGLARWAKNLTDEQELSRDGWRPVTGAGPAFREAPYVGVNKKFDDVPNPIEHGHPEQGQWVFPKNVAESIEDMFAPRKWQAWRKQHRIGGVRVGIDAKLDDLVFIPKRAKLYGSLFQQVDFASRMGLSGFGTSLYRIIEGMRLLGVGMLRSDPDAYHQAFRHLVEAHTHIVNIPKGWRNMVEANFSPRYREVLRNTLNSQTPIYDDTALSEYTWFNLQLYGLHVKDPTIFGPDDLSQVVERLVATGAIKKVGKAIKAAEMAMRRGLFDGVYPAAIMHDVQYNLIPLIRATNPDWTAAQVMSAAAKRANKRWSTIPKEQSVVRGNWREVLTRTSFSLNENESFFRQTVGMVRGPEKMFWTTHWAGAFLFMAAVGNLIHSKVTGEPLPKDRYVPFNLKGWYTFGYGYNPSFLSPDIPIPTRAGDRAMLDLLMQFDFMFRLTDGGYGIPAVSFLNARLGTTPRAILTQATSKDYKGRDIAEWGYLQRALQFVTDEFAPIGAGQGAIALARTAFKDKEISGVTPLGMPVIEPGATLENIAPSIESRHSGLGIAFQSLGFNLKTPSGEMLKDRMVERVFGEGKHPDHEGLVLKTWQDLSKHKDSPILSRIVHQDARNVREVRELLERRQEGAEDYFDDFGKMVEETRESSRKRLVDQRAIVDDTTAMLWDPKLELAWSPSTFRRKLKTINRKHRVTVEAIRNVYGQDPSVARLMEKGSAEPDAAKQPLSWAIHNWARLRQKHSDPVTDEVDFTAFDAEWEATLSAYDDDMADESGALAARFDKWLDQGDHHPFVEQYYDALGQIDDAGYWDNTTSPILASTMARLSQGFNQGLAPIGKDAEDIWSDYLKASAEERRRLAGHSNGIVRRIVKDMTKARKIHRYQTVIANPGIDRLLIMWFGNTPYVRSNGQFYKDLYGKFPSSYRTDPRR